jgi:hypothetical protein
MASLDLAEQALKLKDEGNALLVEHRYALAAEKYTEAIDLMPTAVYYANRAQGIRHSPVNIC